MTGRTLRGRSVETVRAELQAMEGSMTGVEGDPGHERLVDALRREHEAARRALQREVEDDLMALPEAARRG